MSFFDSWRCHTSKPILPGPLIQISRVLLDNPGGRHFGYDLAQTSSVRYVQVLRIVDWMLGQGWMTCGWESAAEADGRLPRRWCRLTDTGVTRLTAIVEKAEES